MRTSKMNIVCILYFIIKNKWKKCTYECKKKKQKIWKIYIKLISILKENMGHVSKLVSDGILLFNCIVQNIHVVTIIINTTRNLIEISHVINNTNIL